ncbi:hypothetical protein [Leptospira idonii]|uniref:Uncharacterized protein n=1 Tax=Leptospira idonii TaxID=1193500 RepID=A0A4R9LXW9_9LEPT|nr:hypothetical protein [Leptospira idonii]TGN18167.1 hypothetical protein EHS15_12180 [Leptospira idonii]
MFCFSLYADEAKEHFELYLKTKIPTTKLKDSHYKETINPSSDEDAIESEFEFYIKKCTNKKIVSLSKILKPFSSIDSLIYLKNCSEPGQEQKIKQKLFEIIQFPKLEILETEIQNPEIKKIAEEILPLWEDRVYVFSNFYDPHTLVWYGKEKGFTEEINRIVYKDMPEHRKKTMLLRIKEDLLLSNQQIYHIYSYSTQSPWNEKNLLSENKRAEGYYLKIMDEWGKDPTFPSEKKQQLQELSNCITALGNQEKKFRLLGFYGFFTQYGTFTKESDPEEEATVQFLRKNIYHSAHFERRWLEIRNSCLKQQSLP